MRGREARRPTARSARWLVVGIVLTILGLSLTHVPGAPATTASPRAESSRDQGR